MANLNAARAIVITVALLLVLPVSAQQKSLSQQILDIENNRIDAMLKKDLQAIDAIMADNAIHITTDGSLRTKAQYLEKMRSTKGKFNHFKLYDFSIRLFNNMAIVTGHYENSKKVNKVVKPTKYGVFTRIYHLLDKKWKLVSHQATVVQKPVIK